MIFKKLLFLSNILFCFLSLQICAMKRKAPNESYNKEEYIANIEYNYKIIKKQKKYSDNHEFLQALIGKIPTQITKDYIGIFDKKELSSAIDNQNYDQIKYLCDLLFLNNGNINLKEPQALLEQVIDILGQVIDIIDDYENFKDNQFNQWYSMIEYIITEYGIKPSASELFSIVSHYIFFIDKDPTPFHNKKFVDLIIQLTEIIENVDLIDKDNENLLFILTKNYNNDKEFVRLIQYFINRKININQKSTIFEATTLLVLIPYYTEYLNQNKNTDKIFNIIYQLIISGADVNYTYKNVNINNSEYSELPFNGKLKYESNDNALIFLLKNLNNTKFHKNTKNYENYNNLIKLLIRFGIDINAKNIENYSVENHPDVTKNLKELIQEINSYLLPDLSNIVMQYAFGCKTLK